MFSQARLPNFLILLEEKRKSRHFWHTSKNVGCFTHLFWTNYQSFCIFLFNYKVTPVILVKNAPDFGKLYRKRIFSYQFLTILPESKNILHKCHLWQISCDQTSGWTCSNAFRDWRQNCVYLRKPSHCFCCFVVLHQQQVAATGWSLFWSHGKLLQEKRRLKYKIHFGWVITILAFA